MKKAKEIFKLINDFRKNPKALAKHLENIKKFLDKNTMVLSEPGKIQVQMVEGEMVFNEAIDFLLSLHHLKPLEWDENLALSAIEHVLDIGPKGLLSYQSSDGTEPEDRITKYGNYLEALGENIDFGPNDAMGVIVSLTLDDGEADRPHRDNLFKSDYQKVGIACGPHKTEYQMCVMDFAFDFVAFNEESEIETQNQSINISNYNKIDTNAAINGFKEALSIQSASNQNMTNKNLSSEIDLFVDPKATAKFSTNTNKSNQVSNKNETRSRTKNEETFGSYNNLNYNHGSSKHNSPLVRLSLDQSPNEVTIPENNIASNNLGNINNNFNSTNKLNNANNLNTFNPNSNNKNSSDPYLEDDATFAQYPNQIRALNSRKKVVSKMVEVTTKIIYTYEDGTIKEVSEKISNLFNGDT